MWDIITMKLLPPPLSLFFVLCAVLLIAGVHLGIETGKHGFGVTGGIAGGILGFVIGFFVGAFPDCLMMLFLFRKIQKSTNEELRARVALPDWNFSNTLALRQLTDRGQDIRVELLRIIDMLESADQLARMDGWDALWLGTEEYKLIEDYNPHNSILERRAKIEVLKAAIQNREENRY